jgi:predicted GIY-YIG superfamily endonuclease
VYRIACRKLRAVYIGQTSDLARRVLQHLARPPIHMRHDLQCCRPLARHFQISVLKEVQTRAYADSWEAQLIAEHRAAGFRLYNRLGSAPRYSNKQLFAMLYRCKVPGST